MQRHRREHAGPSTAGPPESFVQIRENGLRHVDLEWLERQRGRTIGVATAPGEQINIDVIIE